MYYKSESTSCHSVCIVSVTIKKKMTFFFSFDNMIVSRIHLNWKRWILCNHSSIHEKAPFVGQPKNKINDLLIAPAQSDCAICLAWRFEIKENHKLLNKSMQKYIVCWRWAHNWNWHKLYSIANPFHVLKCTDIYDRRPRTMFVYIIVSLSAADRSCQLNRKTHSTGSC